MERIIAHWTAGTYNVGKTDEKHYHAIVSGSNDVVLGKFKISDNKKIIGENYAMHTYHSNTGSIGIACAGMKGAKESPLVFGDFPIKYWQFETMCQQMAEWCYQYGIKITDETVLTHAEVEDNLGIKQKAKWDISYLKFKPELKGAKACGNYMRSRVKYHLDILTNSFKKTEIEVENSSTVTIPPLISEPKTVKSTKSIIVIIVALFVTISVWFSELWEQFINWIGF